MGNAANLNLKAILKASMKNWSYKNFVVHQFEGLDSISSRALETVGARRVFDGIDAEGRLVLAVEGTKKIISVVDVS